jgi:hypothetical protein
VILPPGITGFVAAGEFTAEQEHSFADFKGAVFHAARVMQGTVLRLDPAATTSNFHSALLRFRDDEVVVLCNSCSPVIAFAEAPVVMSAVRFRDHPTLKHAIESVGAYTVASALDLGRPLSPDDLARVGPADLEQIRHWKPRTVGEVVFNWFD